ncbi:hypothetical protein MMC17_005323 [Xylographa soralifera]|nr:hypothetical protein [Xylographa soralifera]
MTILFESLETVYQDGAIVPQPPQEKNLLSVTAAVTTKQAIKGARKKAKRDELISTRIDKHARLIAQEKARVGFEVGYYTNTKTREYRTLSYSPSVRERVLAGEMFPKALRIELLRGIPGYTEPRVETLDGCTSPNGKKSRKRSHSAAGSGDTDATDAATTATPIGHRIWAGHRPVGRPRKRLATGTIVLEATSSLPTIITGNATTPDGVSPKHTVEDQPCPEARPNTRTDDGRNRSQRSPSLTCQESCPHPLTGKEQLVPSPAASPIGKGFSAETLELLPPVPRAVA